MGISVAVIVSGVGFLLRPSKTANGGRARARPLEARPWRRTSTQADVSRKLLVGGRRWLPIEIDAMRTESSTRCSTLTFSASLSITLDDFLAA